MSRVTGLAGTVLQRQLSEFLYSELLHTLGVYRYACEKQERLKKELNGAETRGARRLKKVVEASLYCNEQLRDHLHRAAPKDAAEPGSGRRPSPFRPDEEPPRPSEKLLTSISTFYEDAAVAMAMHLEEPERHREKEAPAEHVLGAKLAFVHDPQRRGRIPQWEEVVKGRIERTMGRHAKVRELLRGEPNPYPVDPVPDLNPERIARIEQALIGCAGGDHGQQLLTILDAMNEAHMWMHQAEHKRAQNFGEMFSGVPETQVETLDMLRYSLALNTFVFSTARATPWVFAEDEDERDYVIANYEDCCRTLAPTYCMWIATQFSLLALHRRAFTYWTMGAHDSAYRDFYKLTRLLRGLRQPVERRGLRVPGTKTFIEGVIGMSEHHIGRIYRGQHAHRMALRYFERASRHLDGWEEDEEIGPLVKNSHWRINLFINEGKANYELGRIKRSFLYYARAWRAFLLLVESDTHAIANVDVVERFTKWMEPIVDEPELNRRELRVRLEPLVEQFATLRTPPHLRLLAADIVMRMGHLLFIIKLPPAEWDPGDPKAKRPPKSDQDLAGKCIAKAAFLDPSSTLTAADLLKIEHETGEQVKRMESIEPDSLSGQWPSGSGRFEEAARITEYTLQRWLATTTPEKGEPEPKGRLKVARELLGAFLAHTDSSNVKLAQVYRYLMQGPTKEKRDSESGKHTLDFVCLRRYSSFFPFLPRPSAFRAPGGGYFVQVHEPDEEMFGIAVDPGPDFIENLYRCGYGLADIHMIVLTHDHADHIVSLDSMLALMGIRKGLGDGTFGLANPQTEEVGRRLAIVGNESVCRRYSFYNCEEHPTPRDGKPKTRIDAVRVLNFGEIDWVTQQKGQARKEAIEEKEILLKPETLRIEPVKTWGHADANGFVSQGFLLSVGEDEDRSSILITGDTGRPSTLGGGGGEPHESHRLAGGSKSLRKAVKEADVVVAHLSSVPLRELRQLAELDSAGDNEAITEFSELWARAVERATESEPPSGHSADYAKGIEQTEFLLNQIQFGFRSKPADPTDGFTVSPFSDIEKIKDQPDQHLYLMGLLEVAEAMAMHSSRPAPLLLIGELREELGTFRTRIASQIAEEFFAGEGLRPSALTTDIGLRVRLCGPANDKRAITVLCTTCDLDNDLIPVERFHRPREIREVCVKGEDEGVFYNCSLHSPREQDDYLWLEQVERYDVFGDQSQAGPGST